MQEKGEIMKSIELTRMRSGEHGRVIKIAGGFGIIKKLEVLGIRPGVEIEKISAQIMKGPVIVKFGNTQLALGFGMARRVIVEPVVEKAKP